MYILGISACAHKHPPIAPPSPPILNEPADDGMDWNFDDLDDDEVIANHPHGLDYTPTIYFAFDASEIRDSERDKLAALRDLAGTCVVEGYTSPEGTDDYNLALGHARASMVALYLKTIGCKARLTTISYGENSLVSNGDASLYWMDRRATVRCL